MPSVWLCENRQIGVALVKELRRVVSGRQTNLDCVLCSAGPIKVFQPFAKRMGRDPHDCIYLWIKIIRASERLNGDTIFLDVVNFSFEVLFTHKAQKSNEVVRSANHSHLQNYPYFCPLAPT